MKRQTSEPREHEEESTVWEFCEVVDVYQKPRESGEETITQKADVGALAKSETRLAEGGWEALTK